MSVKCLVLSSQILLKLLQKRKDISMYENSKSIQQVYKSNKILKVIKYLILHGKKDFRKLHRRNF